MLSHRFSRPAALDDSLAANVEANLSRCRRFRGMPSTVCGWCTRFANMTRVGPAVKVDQYPIVHIFALFSCDYCNAGSMAMVTVGSSELGGYDNELDHLLGIQERELQWLPSRGTPQPYDDVPDHIASAASEAHQCRSIHANRAAVLMARAVVEATAKEKDVTKGPLSEKIDALHKQGLVRELVKDQAHEIRHLGNDMAHGDFVDPVTDEEADETLTLMAEVLEEVFQAPARLERVRQARLAKQQGSTQP